MTYLRYRPGDFIPVSETTSPRDYVRRIARPVRDEGSGELVGFEVLGFLDRPPFGPPLAGRRSTAAGRGHRRSASPEAVAERRELAERAFDLRTQGWTLARIAAEVGRSPSTVAVWLRGVRPPKPLTEAQQAQLHYWRLFLRIYEEGVTNLLAMHAALDARDEAALAAAGLTRADLESRRVDSAQAQPTLARACTRTKRS